MKHLVDLIWGFDLIFQKSIPEILAFLKIMGCLFLGYIILHPYIFVAENSKNIPLDSKDFIVIATYTLILILGILYNLKSLDIAFFKSLLNSLLVVIGRVLLLTLIVLVILFIVKILAMIFFKISPEVITKNSDFTDIVWYYPMIQLPYFFFLYKKSKTTQIQKGQPA